MRWGFKKPKPSTSVAMMESTPSRPNEVGLQEAEAIDLGGDDRNRRHLASIPSWPVDRLLGPTSFSLAFMAVIPLTGLHRPVTERRTEADY